MNSQGPGGKTFKGSDGGVGVFIFVSRRSLWPENDQRSSFN